MKLLYLTDRLSHRGGAPHHLLDVIGAMAAHHQVTVAAASIDADIRLPDAISVHTIGGLRSPTKTLTPLESLVEWADLVHLQNVMIPSAIEQATRIPSVVTVQDHRMFCPGPGRTLPTGVACDHAMSDRACSGCVSDAPRLRQLLAKAGATAAAIRAADRLVVLSRYMARAVESAGIGRAAIIPPPVDTAPPKTDPGHGFLMAGRMAHLKGPDLGYAAWQRSGVDHPLRVAGLGAMVERMPHAECLGWLDRHRLRERLAEARAVVFPTRWQEPFGIVGAEALAVGTPVIAMPTGGMMDWGTEGTLLTDGVTAMAAAIRTLADNPERALSLGRAGQRRVAHLCDPPRVHAMLAELYTDAVGSDEANPGQNG